MLEVIKKGDGHKRPAQRKQRAWQPENAAAARSAAPGSLGEQLPTTDNDTLLQPGIFFTQSVNFSSQASQCHLFLSACTHPAELSLAPAELQLVLHAMLYFTADIYTQPAQPQPDGMRQQQHRQYLHHFLASPLCVCGGLGQGGLASSCPNSATLSPSCLSRDPRR